jgi:cytochrome c oxidase assembly protein subunit 15
MSASKYQHPEATPRPDEASPEGGALPAERTLDEIRAAAWLKVLLFFLFALVLIGGTVRITYSGLSIPEWPIIYYGPEKTKPSLLPPFTEQAWETAHQTYHSEVIDLGVHGDPRTMQTFKREFKLEYTHRFTAAVVSILFLALIVQTIRKPVLRRRIGMMIGISAAVLFAQIVLGGVVVKTHTPALSVSYHLGMAFIYIGMIFWMMLRLGRPEGAALPPRSSRHTWLAWTAAVLCFLQIFSGGLVANTEAGRSYNTWPLMAESLIPPANAMWQSHFEPAIMNLVENKILVQWTHRWFAFVVAAAILLLVVRLVTSPLSPLGRFMARASVFVLVTQILLGIVTLLEAVQPWTLGIAHLGVGLILFLILLGLVYELKTNVAVYEHETASAPASEPGKESRLEVQAASLS